MTSMTTDKSKIKIKNIKNLEFDKICFVDIEANDIPEKEIIQFAGLKQTRSINLYIKPKHKISPYIQKFTKISNDFIIKFPEMTSQWKALAKFISAKIIVSFGNYDYWLLQKTFSQFSYQLDNKFFDLQDYIKLKTKISPSLKAFANILDIKIDKNKFHDGFYDAKILKEIFASIKNFNDTQLLNAAFLSKVLENQQVANLKLIKASQAKNSNILVNQIDSPNICLRVEQLEIGTREFKSENIQWIKSLKFIFIDYTRHVHKHYSFCFPNLNTKKSYLNYKKQILSIFDTFLELLEFHPIVYFGVKSQTIKAFLNEVLIIKNTILKLKYASFYKLKKLRRDLHSNIKNVWKLYSDLLHLQKYEKNNY